MVWHSFFFSFLSFAVVLSSYRTCCALLPAGYDYIPTCAGIFFSLVSQKKRWVIVLSNGSSFIAYNKQDFLKYEVRPTTIENCFSTEEEGCFFISIRDLFIVPLEINAEIPLCLVQYIKKSHLCSPSEVWWWHTSSEIHQKLLPLKPFSPFLKLLSFHLWKLRGFCEQIRPVTV